MSDADLPPWRAPYHRFHEPLDDGDSFGAQVHGFSALDLGRPAPFLRTVVREPDIGLPPSTVFGDASSVSDRKFLEHGVAACVAGVTQPLALDMFLPDHACVLRDPEPCLLEESLWHSELFYSRHFRCDRGTKWVWKSDRNWTPDTVIEEPVNQCYHRYSYQYFHWIFDVLWRAWAFGLDGEARSRKWVFGPLNLPFQLPSLALFDIKPDDCIWFDTAKVVRLDHAACPAFRFDETLMTRRPDYNSGEWFTGFSRNYLRELEDRARRRTVRRDGPERIYVTRAGATHRRITNEAEIVARLEARGFAVVNPGTLSFNEQVATFSNARVIVGAHGAGLTNLIWAKPGCTLLEFAPEGLGDIGYRFAANLRGDRHMVVLCPSLPSKHGLPYADITVTDAVLNDALLAVG